MKTRKSTRTAKTRWPAGKPIPTFKSLRDEERFWLTHELDDGKPEDWEELVYEPRANRKPREHVYRIRLDDLEMAAIQKLARGRGVTGSVVVRDLIRAAAVREK